jgi:formiminotetrahydrofolate cyclodeaminase
MSLTDKSVSEILAAFRSSSPTPGGGSASALAGAIGASLLAMVAGLPKPNTEHPNEIEQLARTGEHCTALAERLAGLIDRDSDAYDLVVNAYKLPKASDAEKAARSASIQEALKAATEAPLQVMRDCRAALRESDTVARFGNRNASSDVQVGIELLNAGLRGARLNVDINLGSIKDAAYLDAVKREVEELGA